jgi:hypothetical protein
MSAHAARFVAGQLARQEGVETEVIDIATMPLPVDDAGEAIRDAAFSTKMNRADALVIVSPEYNHSFPGLNFGNVSQAFSESGELWDQAFVRRADKFLNELIWMAETLRDGREHIPLRS